MNKWRGKYLVISVINADLPAFVFNHNNHVNHDNNFNH